jgi:hypothetical protein
MTATLEATMLQPQPLQLPVVGPVLAFLGVGPSASYTNGEVHVRLTRGVIRVQRLALSGATSGVMLEGTVNLQGRLDLEATATSGNLWANLGTVSLLGTRIPRLGPLPLSLVLEASRSLSHRIVHLRVVGTLHSPIIRVEPTSLLTEEAIRFLLSRASVPLP